MTQYLIDFKNDATQADIDAYLLANNCQILKIFSKLENTYHVETDLTLLVSDIIDHIINNDSTHIQLLTEIPIVPLNLGNPITLSTSEEKDWWKVYSCDSVDHSNPAPTIMKHGKGTNVYMVDSGIEITHPEFAGSDISLVYSFTDSFDDNTGHGTALSSVIIGNTCAMTDASLKVVKIFDNNVATKQSDILYALDAILHDAIASQNNVSIVNMSWSIARNTYIEDKIRLLVHAGLLVVCASGNAGIPINDVTPAAMDEVITVGSYNDSFNPSNFANYTGALSTTPGVVNTGALDSWAPGEQIWAAALGGGYNFTGGTSMSSAIYSASMAYNTSQLITETNDILSLYRETDRNMNTQLLISRDRSGILNLSDPKYAASVNRICTYHNDWFVISANRPVSYAEKVVCKVGVRVGVQFSNVSTTASYEVLTTLPEFVTIERTMLIIMPTSEPLSSTNVDIHDIQIRITPTNTTITPYITTIRVVVTGTAFDATTLPADDPLIDITLQSLCFILVPPCTGGTGCGFSSPCNVTTGGKHCSCLPP